jgi:hypothetical protein
VWLCLEKQMPRHGRCSLPGFWVYMLGSLYQMCRERPQSWRGVASPNPVPALELALILHP